MAMYKELLICFISHWPCAFGRAVRRLNDPKFMASEKDAEHNFESCGPITLEVVIITEQSIIMLELISVIIVTDLPRILIN